MSEHKKISLASPDIQDSDIAEVVRVLRSGMLVQGTEVALLEEQLAEYLSVKHCIAASNGTATLHLSLIGLGIGPGDEVIVPAFSYVATANVVELVGAKPIFVDVEPSTFNIDPSKIQSVLSKRTKAIIPVHEFGLAANMDEIIQIASTHDLAILEDAACALGSSFDGTLVGGFGAAGSFSFHPRKAITSGEGGVISTNDDALANQLRTLRNHGIEMRNNKMDFVSAGFNYRMTDFQAALLKSQLSRFPQILAYKAQLASIYLEYLTHPLVRLPVVPAKCVHSWQTFHVVLDPRIDRDHVLKQLREKGIYTNYGAQCIPEVAFYKKKYGLNSMTDFPYAFEAFNQGLALPLHEKLTPEDIFYIIQSLHQILESC